MQIKNELEIQEREEAIAKKDNLIKSMQTNIWGHSTLGIEAKNAAMAMLSTKTGLYARIPIPCKEDACPYSDTCSLLEHGLAPLGDKCPWETALIETRYAGYMDDYSLNESSFTDCVTVSEIVTLDVMIERSKALMAKEGVQITDVVAGMTETGEQFTRPEISKAQELYERNLKKRMELLKTMLGTRESRKGMGETQASVSDLLSQAINGTEFIIEEKPSNM